MAPGKSLRGNYKGIVAIDMDGTLLRPDETVSPFSIATLQQVERLGYLVLLCSGRPYRALRPTYEKLGCKGPCVCYNGGLVFDPSDPSFPKREYRFPKEELADVYQKARPYAGVIEAEDGETLFATSHDDFLEIYFPTKGIKTSYGEFPLLPSNPYTFLFSYRQEDKETLRKEFSSLKDLGFRFWRDRPYAELFSPEADKAKALLYVMEQYGISKENVYAFGDGSNDKCMLRLSGHPYAMSNAKPDLLEGEFPITKKGNSEDGVALTLKEIFRL